LTLAGSPVAADPATDHGVDQRFMRMAIALGERHVGRTWPNPSVGALVVAGDAEPRIVAQGITGAGGRPHAERLALDVAGGAARGATLYVSLEPCAHHGKTPPCVDAIIAAGIARVVTALEDPDARVRGRGHAVLRNAGIAVATGVLADEAGRAHRGHIWRVVHGRPFVTLKLARTADGYAARMAGPRLMISDESAIARVHMMRAHADAILVGVGTILADDPQLTVRLPGLEDRSPVRVIFDSRLRTPLAANVVAGAAQVPTWIVTTPDASAEAERALAERGVEILRVAASADGQLDPHAALAALARRGITRIFTEGGPSLAACFARAGLLDEVMISTSPNALGEPGRPAVGRDLEDHIAAHFRPVRSEMVGADRLDAYERKA
jgi:diaminohydroxyphosphoribosylaminopyrimidine deaminase / 5-amino-6-(5-phosphoribosylamino)uracil reductase